mmetsp:Transcript_28474/g.90751  ORF Transcript_28474/g.90751 Transcript_28474/m.90751 type:complete len:215 (+) Transcript_28474:79-723(+)
MIPLASASAVVIDFIISLSGILSAPASGSASGGAGRVASTTTESPSHTPASSRVPAPSTLPTYMMRCFSGGISTAPSAWSMPLSCSTSMEQLTVTVASLLRRERTRSCIVGVRRVRAAAAAPIRGHSGLSRTRETSRLGLERPARVRPSEHPGCPGCPFRSAPPLLNPPPLQQAPPLPGGRSAGGGSCTPQATPCTMGASAPTTTQCASSTARL